MARYPCQLAYIADGFTEDCDELIHRCLQLETLTYHSFCQIWKDMQFACIFHGRTSVAEIAELSEEVLQIAKHYMVANTSNFEKSVAGLFLVYALLNLQPYTGFAALRLVPEDVAAINRIELVARREQRYDVLYVLGSVLIEGPCQYHAAQRERGMEYSLRKYLEGYINCDKQSMRPKGVFYRQNEELDIIRELNVLSRRYSEAKAAINGPGNKDRNLSYTNDNLISELDTSLRKVISGIHDNEEVEEETTQDHYNAVQDIKAKAMSESVNQMKRFTAVDDRRAEEITLNKTPELKSKPGKIKTGSPTKPLTTNSPRKRSGSKMKSPKKKKGKPASQDNTHDNKRTSKTDTNTNVTKTTDNMNNLGDDINLDEFVKAKEVGITEIGIPSEEAVEFQIEPLPLFIRTQKEGEMHLEIEVIDQYEPGERKEETVIDQCKQGEQKEKTEVKKYVRKKRNTKKEDVRNNELPDLSIEKVQKSNIGGDCSQAGNLKNNSEIAVVTKINTGKDTFKKQYKLKKPDKREMKKTILKSKFKKMGMLPVANFNDK